MHDRLDDTVDGHVPNENYDSDIRYTLQLCQWVLKSIGIWSLIYHHTSRFEKFVSLVLRIMSGCALFIVLIPFGYFAIFIAQDVTLKVKMLGPLAFCAINTIKYCYFGIKRSVFIRCIRHMERDWKFTSEKEYRRIMRRNVTIGRNLTTVCALFLYAGNSCYYMLALISVRRFSVGNVTIRPLAYPGYDEFFDSQASPAYEIVFFMNCLYVWLASGITTGACSLAAVFVTHACGQIQVQMTRLRDMVKERVDGKRAKDPLGAIVHDHVEMLRFSRNVDEVLREICLLEIVTSTFIICLIEYYCMMEWANSDAMGILTYVILFVSFSFNILILCYVGELLADQCSKIGPASYDIEWYNLPEKRALGLILLMAISNHPPKLTAGKIFDLSLNTFGAVLKSSVGYLSLLRSVTEWY